MHTAVNDPHVHPERLAREVSDISHVVAQVAECHDPMEDRGPYAHPGCKSRIDGGVVHLYDVVDGVVEKGDESSDADNGQRLAGQETEDHGGECG